MSTEISDLVKIPSQLGSYMSAARQTAGDSLDDIAQRMRWRFTPTTLSMIERGDYSLTKDDLAQLLDAYGVDPYDLRSKPERATLVIDPFGRYLASGTSRWELRDVTTVDQLLEEYLRFAHELEECAPGAPIQLHDRDIAVLADTLQFDPETIEQRLVEKLERYSTAKPVTASVTGTRLSGRARRGGLTIRFAKANNTEESSLV